MIADLCDWSNTFLGKDAKWVDSCAPSVGSGLVTLKNWTITSALTDQSLIGGTAIDDRGCWQFAQWTKWTPYAAQMGFDAVKTMLIDPSSHIDQTFTDF
jgi:hypothetical protein